MRGTQARMRVSLGVPGLGDGRGVAFSAKPSRFTTSASNHGISFLDSVMTRYVNERGCADKIRSSFLNNLEKTEHHLLLRGKKAGRHDLRDRLRVLRASGQRGHRCVRY